MIFDFINGSSLLDFIVSHNFLTEKVARPLFRQILSAIGILMFFNLSGETSHLLLKFPSFLNSLLPSKLNRPQGPEN